jgi:hypothetical protein
MSNSLEVQQILDHCMLSIEGARKAMAGDMNDAAMKLGAAAMMLASASHAVHTQAGQRPQAPTPPDTPGTG